MRLLLDAHISPAVARELARAGVDAVAVRDWLGGEYQRASDDELLSAAASDHRVLVTFDVRTIPPLLKEWIDLGHEHAGVVLVDGRTIRQNDIGGLVRALLALVRRDSMPGWRNRVVFLQAGSRST